MQSEIRDEARWRALILFGLNVATYKFAFAQALLDVAKSGQSTVSLNQLSLPYAQHLVRHLGHTDKQGTSSSSRFLDACRQHRDGQLNEATLKDVTLELGFTNVVDAFQNVSGAMGQTPFYNKDFKRGQKNLVLTDALLGLGESKELGNLPHEIEARWRLVETAWSLKVPRNTLVVQRRKDDLIIEHSDFRRIDITPVRGALNGYQDGHCFYTDALISIETHDAGVCHVDHVIPHRLKPAFAEHGINLDGVWNLVLASSAANLSKSDRLPHRRFIEKLHARNEYYIESKHPLAETIMNHTGFTAAKRTAFMNRVLKVALNAQGHTETWSPKDMGPAHTLPWHVG